MVKRIEDYRQISCGCCTGREVIVQAPWGPYADRADQCVCAHHVRRGGTAVRCSKHVAVDKGAGAE